MNRLKGRLTDLKDRGEGAFMPFLVIGDPDLESSMALTEALVEGGADILEFGFPFSDPPADGPVIEAADMRALAAGVTPPACFEFLDEVNRRWDTPVALLIYFNLVMQYGVDAFYRRAAQAGVDAVLVADCPVEHSAELALAAKANGIAPVFIASALTSNARLARISEVAEGYLYVVARIGITGEQSTISDSLPATIARFRDQCRLPMLAGFGISSPDHVHQVLKAGADGVICGSAIVRRIANHLHAPNVMIKETREFVAQMKAATRSSDRKRKAICSS